MPSWNEILAESRAASQYDLIRRRYLATCHEITGRNVIAYLFGLAAEERDGRRSD